MNKGTYIECDGLTVVDHKPKQAKPDINVLARFRAWQIDDGIILAPIAKTRLQVKEWANTALLDADVISLCGFTARFDVNGEVKTVKQLIETYCKDVRKTYFVETD